MSALLGDLFDLYGTDKARGHCHLVYGPLFHREQVTDVLEIGIGTLNPDAPWTMAGHAHGNYRPGGSLRAWRQWFPHATIWGIDIASDTQFTEERIVTVLADSTDPVALDNVLPQGLCFDFIVDDGDHSLSAQSATLSNLWPRVRGGGFYAVEDRKRALKHTHVFNAITGVHPYATFGSIVVYQKGLDHHVGT